ncbi:RES family NAD+ phosphorylase [Mycobacterium heidelbergense]|uniref:RES family NAD+ phosphorylase n=1 Tax=Mycobacterium heidelbergense TaxID=53376 RepID=UPI003CFAA9CF
MSGSPVDGPLWRVGYYRAPVDFTPLDLYGFSHRFDDADRRFRTLYLASLEVTCLREVLADFRPNLAARQRHIERYGPEAADDFPVAAVTAKWRRENVLVLARLELDGPVVDLFDADIRQELEDRHAALLVEYGLEHLDLGEITTKRRKVTQSIAGDLYDRGAAGVRFPSRLDGNVCVALFEGRGTVDQVGDVVALTDPPPEALSTVVGGWKLKMQDAP